VTGDFSLEIQEVSAEFRVSMLPVCNEDAHLAPAILKAVRGA